jgi:putative PIN family toxin of toxin-antitoxin system
MRVLIDTNVLFSAALYYDGTSRKAYNKAVMEPNAGIVCDYSVDELKRVFNRKFPHMLDRLDKFLSEMLTAVTIVSTPMTVMAGETDIRDEKDRPILRAAIKARADIILSGDKDFLESGIKKPRMVYPAEFLTLKK